MLSAPDLKHTIRLQILQQYPEIDEYRLARCIQDMYELCVQENTQDVEILDRVYYVED